MATEKPTVNKQTFYIFIIIVFIAGFLTGVGYTVYKSNKSPVADRQKDSGQNLNKQEEQAILNLEKEVTAHPENVNAWVQLGHLYFDSDQYDKAIGAYNKSLEFHSGNANLLTDLGVMYRRAGKPAQAIESFDRAITMDSTHEQSRLNKGIVLHFDFGKTREAVAVWESVLKMKPEARLANGESLRTFIERIKNEQ